MAQPLMWTTAIAMVNWLTVISNNWTSWRLNGYLSWRDCLFLPWNDISGSPWINSPMAIWTAVFTRLRPVATWWAAFLKTNDDKSQIERSAWATLTDLAILLAFCLTSSVVDLTLRSCWCDSEKYWKNHWIIGQFQPLPRCFSFFLFRSKLM